VARRLFALQSTPWEESLFMTRWQTQLPGVGSTYTVLTDYLRGLAVMRETFGDNNIGSKTRPIQHNDDDERNGGGDRQSTGQDTGERFWKFMPADELLTRKTLAVVSASTATASEPFSMEHDKDVIQCVWDPLFAWKDSYTLDELQPYLNVVVDATGLSQGDVLLQYTKLVTYTGAGGVEMKRYQRR